MATSSELRHPSGAEGPFHLPLNPDAHLVTTATNANQGMFGATLGLLDGSGRGAALLGPIQAPEMIGVTLDHAFVAIDTATLALTLTSNAVPLTLVP